MAKPQIITVVSRLSALALSSTDGAASSWIQVARTGDFDHAIHGKFSISAANLQQMHDNFATGKHPVPPTELCMDYDHLVMDPQTPGDGKAAGWIKELELREDGAELWARVEWTTAGADYIRAKEYRYVSPTFHRSYKNPTGDSLGYTLLGAAVTNLPFLQGMQPLTIAASARLGLNRRTPAAVISLTEFSHSEICRRVQQALEHHLGCDEWSCWVQDTFDAYAIYRRGGTLYRIGYTIAGDGDISFDAAPVEVTVSYTPLSVAASQKGPQVMATITLKDAQGKDIQIDSAVLEATDLVKALRAQVPTGDAKVITAAEFATMQASIVTLKDQVTTLGTRLTETTTKLETSEQALKDRDADTAVTALLTARKLTPAMKGWAKDLYLSNKPAFDAFAASAPTVLPELGTERGTGGSGASDAVGRWKQAATALRQANPQLTQEQAEARALDADPSLYDALDQEHGAPAR